MSEHRATVRWKRETEKFTYPTYNRDHTWDFKPAATVRASAAPQYLGNEDLVDPERAFVASLSSCHMLTFLAMAAKQKFVLDEYTDDAVGLLEKNEEGRLAMMKVTLRPRTRFSGERLPTDDDLDKLHEEAHRHCFIANSVKTEIVVER